MASKALIAAGALVGWFVAQQFARAWRRMDPAEVAALVERLNEAEFGGWFDPLDVLAIVEIESGFRPEASRWEPGRQEASLGLMQLLYSTAKDRGLKDGPAALFDPATNLRLGMAQLQWSWHFLYQRLGTDPTVEQWIGAYNAGVGNVLKGYLPAAYVAKWKRARAQWT